MPAQAPWSPEVGKRLVSQNNITPEQFNAFYPPTEPDPLSAVMPEQPPLGQTVTDPVPAVEAPPPPDGFLGVPGLTAEATGQGMSKVANSMNPMLWNVPQQPDNVAQQPDNGLQNAAYNPDGAGLIEPAVPGQMQPQTVPAYGEMAMVGQQQSPFTDEIAAINDYANQAQAIAADEAAIVNQQAKSYNDQMARAMEADQKRQAEIDRQLARLQMAEKELAEKKVDPNRFWADKSTGQKITAGVAMILGGFGAARTGQNLAVKVIEDAIGRDIEQQRFDIKAGQDSLVQKRGILGDMMGLFKDERLARDAAMAQGFNLAKLKLEGIAARSRGNETRLKAAQAIAGIEQKRMEYMGKFQAGLARNSFMTLARQGVPVSEQALPQEDRELMVGIPGKKFYGFARSKSGADAIRGKVNDIESGRQALDELITIAEAARTNKLSPALNAKVETIRGALMGKLRLALIGPGAMTEYDFQRLEKIIADPSKIMSLGNEGVRLRELKKMVDYGWEQELNSHGLVLPENEFLNSIGARRK